MRQNKLVWILFAVLAVFSACNTNNNKMNSLDEKVNKAVIYEVNIRQYTPEGTFAAFEEHIPRLKELGVDILWLMPIYPIGQERRKGTLGSYYSVENYTAINPDYGTAEDLHKLIDQAHQNGMLVILDWVANHTSWDNPWIKEHPDWYTHDSTGKIIPPHPDWSDVADLNYDNKEMRAAMIAAMKYWVEEFDVDGFRCDVAMEVPTDFWEAARDSLEKVKHVFMLAEAEQPDLMYKAFDAYYGWHLHHIMNQISQAKMTAKDLTEYFNGHAKEFPMRAIRMNFTSNHDENSWNGTVYERMPESYKTFAVLSFTVPGMPLIYSGQEACLHKRLSFFGKDTIEWHNCDMTDLYTELTRLKHEHSSLWHDSTSRHFEILKTDKPETIFAFRRANETDTLIAIFNLSAADAEFTIEDKLPAEMRDYFTDEKVDIGGKQYLPGWGYRVLVK